MKYTRWSFRHTFNASCNFTHHGPPIFLLLHDRQTHSIDILHIVRAHALTLHADISSQRSAAVHMVFCPRVHSVQPRHALHDRPRLSTCAPRPYHRTFCLLALAHPSLITFHKKMIGFQNLLGCSDSTGLGCIEHLRRVYCPFPTRRCVIHDPILLLVFSSRERFTVGEPIEVQLGLPSRSQRFQGGHLLSEEPAVVAAPAAAATVFSFVAPVRCKPCCATRNSCVALQGFARLSVR